LINPPWKYSVSNEPNLKKERKTISIEDFQKLTIPTSVMKDGLVFIWVEKDIISEVIKHMEG